MRIAFYAPMKSPGHPVPSGDRRMGRALISALSLAGHRVTVASNLRSWDGGNPDRQRQIRQAGDKTTRRLIDRWSGTDNPDRPALWFTYHLYHKAPDWLGPAVSDDLGIPYCVAEASYAAKQIDGVWAEGLRASKIALAKASAVFAFSRVDADGLDALVPPDRLHRLIPFLDTTPFDRSGMCPEQMPADLAQRDGPLLLAVGMMRDDAKLASYQLLGCALSTIDHLPWSLVVVGDGPARQQVEAVLPAGRTVFLGALSGDRLPAIYHTVDMLVWPAINEAYGMAILEAQAAGTPVVAGASGGVPEIVTHAVTGLLTPPGDVDAFAKAVADLIDDPSRRSSMSAAAYEKTRQVSSLSNASQAIDAVLRSVS